MDDLDKKIFLKIKEKFDMIHSVEAWRIIFRSYLSQKNTKKFIEEFYNPIVLDKEHINFDSFRKRWGLTRGGFSSAMANDFNEKFQMRYLQYIPGDNGTIDDIQKFQQYCVNKKGNLQKSFLSKIWHCIYPEKYPIWDSTIRGDLGMTGSNFENEFFKMIGGYNKYITEENTKLKQIEDALTEFQFVRAEKLSGMRLIDMGLWAIRNFKKNCKLICLSRLLNK